MKNKKTTTSKNQKETTSKATEYILELKNAENNKTFAIIKGDIAKEFLILSKELKITPEKLFKSIINEEYEKRHGKQKA